MIKVNVRKGQSIEKAISIFKKKVKENGLMIFDDYGWGNCGVGIDAFLECFKEQVHIVHKEWQVMIMKKGLTKDK